MLAELHPPLSGFPLALVCTIVLAEIVAVLRRNALAAHVGHYLLIFLCAVLIATYYSGYFAAERATAVSPETRHAILTHQGFAQCVLLGMFVTLLLSQLRHTAEHGKALFYAAYGFSLCVVFGFVVYTGFLGGQLVFTHGVGVRIQPITP